MLRSAIASVAMLAAVPALADTHITSVNDSGQPSSQLFVKGGKVRMEFNDSGHQGYALYDVASNSMMMVMPDKKQYMVFDDKTASQMGAQQAAAQQQMQGAQQQAQAQMAAHQGDMDAANQKMQAAMANMSPQQQAMMQKMMANRPGGGNPMAAMQGGGMQVEMKDLGTTETIAGHKCKDMQMTVGGRATSSMCMSDDPPSAFGVPAGDYKTLEAMRDGMQKLTAKMGPMAQSMSAVMSKGFALKTTRQSFDPKTMQSTTVTTTFKSVTTENLDSGMFQLPAGYSVITMDQMMHGGHP